MTDENSLAGKHALVTGASRRIGAEIARQLHAAGARVGIHYRKSAAEAESLCSEFNALRDDSAAVFAADLVKIEAPKILMDAFADWAGGVDVLVNNASSFFPTPMGTITESQWEDILGTNLKAPLFLAQCAMPHLRKSHGTIINIIDIHARRPLRDHSVYGSAKAGLEMLTRSLAKELAPEIRVNGIAPGAILWPEQGMTEDVKKNILQQIPLQRPGHPGDVAECAVFLAGYAGYVTGQVIAVDGGRSLSW